MKRNYYSSAYSSKLISTPEAPDSTCKMYSQKTIYSAFSRIDLAYFIAGSSNNNLGGEWIGFEGELMNSPYKYHKPIETSEEWSESYTSYTIEESLWVKDSSEFTSQQSFPQSCKSIEQYSGLSLSHETIHMLSAWAQMHEYMCLNTQFSSSLIQEKLSYAITDPIPMHTHTFYRARETPVSV